MPTDRLKRRVETVGVGGTQEGVALRFGKPPYIERDQEYINAYRLQGINFPQKTVEVWQYEFSAWPETEPTTLVVGFDAKGKVTGHSLRRIE